MPEATRTCICAVRAASLTSPLNTARRRHRRDHRREPSAPHRGAAHAVPCAQRDLNLE
jgi:hypothetical protein